MPLTIPNLDDRTYADLVQEALAMLPRYAPEWTNHNPSDPGITLIELLAYFTEMLIYRLNRISRENKIKFLQLLREVTPEERARLANTSVAEVDEALRRTVLTLRQPQRAVTCEDFEAAATRVTAHNPELLRVMRAHCFARRNLDMPDDQARALERPGHISVLIIPAGELAPEALSSLLMDVRAKLEPMRLLTTRLHIVSPSYLWVSLGASVRTYPAVPFSEVQRQISSRLQNYFEPFPGGGPHGEGWPLGRALYLSEVYELLEHIEGVDYVQDVHVLHLTRTSEALSDDRTAVGIQIGVTSTVGIDTRLGCEMPADTDRLSQDSLGRLMGVLLRPYEFVRIVVQEHDVLRSNAAPRGRAAPLGEEVP